MKHDEMIALVRKHADKDKIDPVSHDGWITLMPHELLAAFNDAETADRAATIKESLPVPDLDRCPSCGGPADNGNDRLIPPNPYVCSKCEDISPDS